MSGADLLGGCRLSADDMGRIRGRMVDAAAGWGRMPAGWEPSPADLLALCRVGAHAIGCGLVDLRMVELAVIETMADGVVDEVHGSERDRVEGATWERERVAGLIDGSILPVWTLS